MNNMTHCPKLQGDLLGRVSSTTLSSGRMSDPHRLRMDEMGTHVTGVKGMSASTESISTVHKNGQSGSSSPSKLSMASSSDSIGSNASSRRIRKTRNISELKKTANVNSLKRQKISFLEFITEKLAGTDNTNSYGISNPNKQQVLPNCESQFVIILKN